MPHRRNENQWNIDFDGVEERRHDIVGRRESDDIKKMVWDMSLALQAQNQRLQIIEERDKLIREIEEERRKSIRKVRDAVIGSVIITTLSWVGSLLMAFFKLRLDKL